MRAKLVEANFERNISPYSSLNIGDSRYIKDAQMYWRPQNSSSVQLDKDGNTITGTSKTIHTMYWIEFPDIGYKGTMQFAKLSDSHTEIMEDHTEATNANINWTQKTNEKSLDPKIKESLVSWTLKNIETLMDNVEMGSKEKYYEVITT